MAVPTGAEPGGPTPGCQQPCPVLRSPCWGRDQDSQSWSSQDSGLATLEISPPAGSVPRRAASPATLPLDEDPSEGICRPSTVLRDVPPSLRPRCRGPRASGGGLWSRSDDISSVSSVSTELSASIEDTLDATVSSSSSAIVTLETDDSGPVHFSGSPGGVWSQPRPCPPPQGVDHRQKTGGPPAGFFIRWVIQNQERSHLGSLLLPGLRLTTGLALDWPELSFKLTLG